MSVLESDIRSLWDRQDSDGIDDDERAAAIDLLDEFLVALESGEIRAAEPTDDGWRAQTWVKRGILLNFGLRDIRTYTYGDVAYNDVLPLLDSSAFGDRGSRNTPDGTTIRRGAYIDDGCILMSPAFVNIGAHIGSGTLIDSCDTIGSCAQIGEDVKIGANTLIGGVLEPVENTPVIVESNVSLGAGCRVTSGFVIEEGCVVGENTLLTPRIPVYDLVENEILYGRLPAGRRAFTRFVESSVGEHDLFESGAYKPAVVATEPGDSTFESVERESALREDT